MGGQIGVESQEGIGSKFWFIVSLEKQQRRSEESIARAQSLVPQLEAEFVRLMEIFGEKNS